MPTPPVPQHCPTPVELDDLELLTSGALGDLALQPAGQPGDAQLPEPVAAQARLGGAVELVDPEGLPLARVSWPGGGGRPADPPPVRPVPRPDADARDSTASSTPDARSSRSATPSPRASSTSCRARSGGPARPGRHRHPVALARGPGPRHRAAAGLLPTRVVAVPLPRTATPRPTTRWRAGGRRTRPATRSTRSPTT